MSATPIRAQPRRYDRDTPDYTDAVGQTFYTCYGPAHEKPTLVRAEDFRWVTRRRNYDGSDRPGTYRYRHKRCIRCRYLTTTGKNGRASRHLTANGLVPIARMRGYLDELEARTGSMHHAARAANVSPLSYKRWQNRADWPTRYRPTTHMTRQSALKILTALRHARSQQRNLDILYHPHAKRRGHCRGCGARAAHRTIACKTCTERHTKWQAEGKSYIDKEALYHEQLL